MRGEFVVDVHSIIANWSGDGVNCVGDISGDLGTTENGGRSDETGGDFSLGGVADGLIFGECGCLRELLEGWGLSWLDRFWKRREIFVEIEVNESLVRGRRLKLPERRVAAFLTTEGAFSTNWTASKHVPRILSLER